MPLVKFDSTTAFANLKANPYSGWPERESANDRFHGNAAPAFTPITTLVPGEMVFTIGSCFARNVEAVLAEAGFQIPAMEFQVDPADWSGKASTLLNNYVVPAIAPQIRWAFGIENFSLEKHCVQTRGKWRDLQVAGILRPMPAEKVLAWREQINAIYRKLGEARVIVLTLGLVEAWWDSHAEMYVNSAPPKAAMEAEPGRFRLHVLSYEEVAQSLEDLVSLFNEVCPADYKVVVTVSPVPLTSTFTTNDVAVANMYSKSVLRAAATAIVYRHPQIGYYPSYESFQLTLKNRAFVPDQVHTNSALVKFNIDRMVAAYLGEATESALAVGRLHRKNGDLKAAKEVLEKAIAGGDDGSLRAELSRVLMDMGEVDAALDVAMHPLADSDVGALEIRARILAHKGLYKEAEEQARAALRLSPTSKPAIMNLIRALIGLGRFDEAEETARDLTKRSYTSERKSNAYLLLAQVHEARGDFDQALAEVDRAEGFIASTQVEVVRERIEQARAAAGGRAA